MQTPVTHRLQQLLQALQHDIATFSQVLGCTQQQLRDYLDHPTGANLDFLATLLTRVDGLRADWLLAGRGPMFDERQHFGGQNAQKGNHGNTIGFNHGLVVNISHAECQSQLSMAMRLVEQQQCQLEDKDRIIRLLEALHPKP